MRIYPLLCGAVASVALMAGCQREEPDRRPPRRLQRLHSRRNGLLHPRRKPVLPRRAARTQGAPSARPSMTRLSPQS